LEFITFYNFSKYQNGNFTKIIQNAPMVVVGMQNEVDNWSAGSEKGKTLREKSQRRPLPEDNPRPTNRPCYAWCPLVPVAALHIHSATTGRGFMDI